MSDKRILDACCGSRMFWFDRKNPAVVFCDSRVVPHHEYYPGRYLEINPDIVCDFTNLPFQDNAFKLVVFDPPHLIKAGDTSWMALKYGKLTEDWEQVLHDGFCECMRVLDSYGTLIFKWSEVQIPLSRILKIIPCKPLFGHKTGKLNKTHWLCFMKGLDKE